jgi:rRNA maturation endonuclease Nob1
MMGRMKKMSDQTSIAIDFDADELKAIANAMGQYGMKFSEFIEYAIRRACEKVEPQCKTCKGWRPDPSQECPMCGDID